ncbi:MAG: hypothetical protein J7K46_09265 [Bacteroidales bacterium]|nr:hypothetical protein [Bacteroidales bacterium]
MKLFRMAWKNLWRNRRRALIKTSSILFGVFFTAMMYALEKGSYENMIDKPVRHASGCLNMQHTGDFFTNWI